MTNNSNNISLGYDLNYWQNYGECKDIVIDVSPTKNSHILLTGMSESGKSYALMSILAKLYLANPNRLFFFGDYKQDTSFSCLRTTANYFPHNRALEALDIVYDIMQTRMDAKDTEMIPVTFLWDEYVSCILSLMNTDKKSASVVMAKVSEMLMLSRSLGIQIILTCQRPDATVFPYGARLNFGVIITLGGSSKSIYEMVIPDHLEQVSGRIFLQGEGVVLINGSHLFFIKIPKVQDENKMRKLCIDALS